MYLIIWVSLVILSQFTGADQDILRSSFENGRNLNPIYTKDWSNETDFTWIVNPPWKHRNDFFNDKPDNNSVEYFGISEEDHITNESYIETSKLTVCNEFRFIPISNSSHQISIAIAILNITKHTNCQNLNPTNKSQLQSHSHRRSNPLIHPFLFVIFGSAFLLIFMAVMVVFIYGFINKQCNQWHRNRSSRRRKKRRKSKNVIRDESTILGVETDIV